jgi:hypothetical protein
MDTQVQDEAGSFVGSVSTPKEANISVMDISNQLHVRLRKMQDQQLFKLLDFPFQDLSVTVLLSLLLLKVTNP